MIGIRLFSRAVVCVVVGTLAPVAVLAQDEALPPATQPATQPTTLPAGAAPITARVLELKGDVKHAPLGSKEWAACQVDDEYPPETMILTGIRSSVKLQIGTDDTYTAMIIEPASKTLISEAQVTQDTKRVNIGVGYGQIRAGVVEGGLKSDFTVSSPVATLSKRGTWNFGLFYERGTDRFSIFLIDNGLVDAFNRTTGRRRQVLPSQIVTQVMRRWLDESPIRNNVPVPDYLGQGDLEVAFNRLQTDGLRVLDPEGGQVVLLDLTSRGARLSFADIARRSLPVGEAGFHLPSLPPARHEGFFGTGRGSDLIPVILGPQSDLVQKGFAKPGTYRIAEGALRGWLKKQGR